MPVTAITSFNAIVVDRALVARAGEVVVATGRNYRAPRVANGQGGPSNV